MNAPRLDARDRPRERPRALSDADLPALVLGPGGGRSARATALSLLEAVPLGELS